MSSNRRETSDKGDKNNDKDKQTLPLRRGPSLGSSQPATSSKDGHGGLGSPSRFGTFAKYTKPKVGPAFQCAVPKYVPPEERKDGDSEGSDSGSGRSSSGAGGSGSASARSSSGRSTGGRGGARGGKGGRGGRGGRGGGRGKGGRGGRGSSSITASTACEVTSKLEQSLANGQTSAVDMANAAAEHMQDTYGTSLANIPRGGLCVHKPLSRRSHMNETTSTSLSASSLTAAGLQNDGSSGSSSLIASTSSRRPPQRLDEHDDFLTYTRNLFLQTPRPQNEMNIDKIWDDETAAKFKVEEVHVPAKSEKGKGRGKKRKASAVEENSSNDDNNVASTSVSTKSDGGDSKPMCISSMDIDEPKNIAKHISDETEAIYPLCGLEDDEQALSYLRANYHGDPHKAKLSIMVNSDRGHGVQRRRQMKKKRKEANKEYPDATTFSSESWRWRVHQARPSMLGDYRSSRDPKYHYFDPISIETDNLLDSSMPWRLQRFGDDDNDASIADLQSPSRTRSYSISWSVEEIEKSKIIWKSIFAYTKHILQTIEEEEDDDDNGSVNAVNKKANPLLCDLLELVGKAHAIPTPEETFGRRDPSARQMSENMNSIIDVIEIGKDCAAKVLKCLKDDGEGIELADLRQTIDEVENKCPVGLTELNTVKRQLQEATLWEEKLENNVDYGTADSDAMSDGEEGVMTEKKLTLEKVERLISKGRKLTLRPRSLVRLQNRVEKAHVLRKKISVWNEARNQENPQNMKFIQSLIKEANKVDLAFPELFTLTGVHKKAEEWMDRASIAARTTISFQELESLVKMGESLPLNVSDVLAKLQKRLTQAKEWMARIEEIVPKSDDYLVWLKRFRYALEDEEKNAHLLSLLSEGSRIPVTMDCSQLLQIEIDARHWSTKAKPWIPDNLGTTGEINAPQKRGKVNDVEEYLDRAASLRDRIWFGDKEKFEWVLDGETQLTEMLGMAETWFEKYDDVISYDNRRKGKQVLAMSKLQTIVEEVNRIPLNIGNSATKINKIFSQAEEWMGTYYPLIKRCGIECTFTPTVSEDPMSEDESTKPLKLDDLLEAVTDADSDLSIDLEVVVKMRKIVKSVKVWVDRVDEVAPKKDDTKRKQQEKHPISELSDLISESSTIIVDVHEEVERLKLEQSTTVSWRLQAQQTLREIVSAFNNFRKQRADACAGGTEKKNTTASASVEITATSNQTAAVIGGSMTTRHINSRRRSTSTDKTHSKTLASGSETPAYVGNGGDHLFLLITGFLNSVKAMNILTPEGNTADELKEVTEWFKKAFALMNNYSEIYERKNFSKLDKLIKSGQKLVKAIGQKAEEIPEDNKLLDDLRQSWAAVVQDDTNRLLDLQRRRDQFVDWCEKADAIVSSTDKKITIETLKELEEQSKSFSSSSEIVLRVQKRAKEATEWVSTLANIIKTGKKIPFDEAKVMSGTGDKLNITCPEYKTLRAAFKATKSWLTKVKKCGVAGGSDSQVEASVITELIKEHISFLVTANDALSNLKQVMCGYCVCRQPYEGFMIGCDGCDEWYHGPCVGITQEQGEKIDKYVCVRCSTFRVYKDNALAVAGILKKWTNVKNLAKHRSVDSQRYSRKVRGAERDIVKAKGELSKYEQELSSILSAQSRISIALQTQVMNGTAATVTSQPQLNGGAVAPASQQTTPVNGASSTGISPAQSAFSEQSATLAKSEKALRDKIVRARNTIVNCEKRMETYAVELVERKDLEAREDSLALNIKKWCIMVKQEVFSPLTQEKAELSRPRNDGSPSAPMNKAKVYAETLGIDQFPDIDAILNSFKILSWALHSLGVLMRKPRAEEIRSILSQTESGSFKLPEAKCVRMLRSMSSRAQIWQSKAKKALAPDANGKKSYDLAVLKEILRAAKQIPLIMPEEVRLWNTIEDEGTRHCICGGPSDGSFMLGCDNCDRWYHGSCMKIDKETGDALSKWICPPCTRGLLFPHQQAATTNVNEEEPKTLTTEEGDKKAPPSVEYNLVNPLEQKFHLDISHYAPDPVELWPPFGLRSNKDAVDVLGKVGDSDNEDFVTQVQPIVRAKQPESSPVPPQLGTASDLKSYNEKISAVTAAAAAPAPPKPTARGLSPFCQPVASGASVPVPSKVQQSSFQSAASLAAATVSQSAAFQAIVAPSIQAAAQSTVSASTLPSVATLTNVSQLPLSQTSTTVASSHTAPLSLPNHDLSAAVANMDACFTTSPSNNNNVNSDTNGP